MRTPRFSNDSDIHVPCVHGSTVASCEESDCEQLRRLLAEDPGEKSDPLIFKSQMQEARTKSEQRNFIEESAAPKGSSLGSMPRGGLSPLRVLFPHVEAIGYADQNRAFKQSLDREVLELYTTARHIVEEMQYRELSGSEKEFKRRFVRGDGLSWRAVEREKRIDRKKLSQAFRNIVARFLKGSPDPGSSETTTGVEIVQVKGKRQRRIFLTRKLVFGSWEMYWSELGEKKGRRSGLTVDKVVLRPIKTSPMRVLLASLAANFSQSHRSTQPELRAGEWEHNVKWAAKRLKKYFRQSTFFSYAEILTALCRHRKICKFCHTPILAGCRLAGRLITRRSRYCDSVCKMRAARQKRLSPNGSLE